MKIIKTTKLSEIQDAFSKKYPGLKLEFYTKQHEDHDGSPKSSQIEDDKAVSELNSQIADGIISTEETRRVSDVEAEFEDKFGLHVQIFRRSNDLWLQTSSTDHWDLKTQNGKGIRSTEKSTS